MSKKVKDLFQYGLGTIVVSIFFATLMMVLFNEIPESNRDAINILLGVTGTITVAVVNYFFGSSKGSSEKNDIIAGNGVK